MVRAESTEVTKMDTEQTAISNLNGASTGEAIENPTGPGNPLPALLGLHIELKPTETLIPYGSNGRTHSKKQIRQLAASISTFGFTNPILIDETNRIIAGHGRVEAAKLLGMRLVPTIRLADLSEAQKRAYIIADNRLAELAGWDSEVLAIELQYLTSLDLDFELEVVGFETGEIDLLIDGTAGAPDPKADLVSERSNDPVVSRVGDLWILGSHKLLCGDARDRGAYDRLLQGKLAQVVFADPPYNVEIEGNVSGLGEIQHREFVMASGEMSEGEFTSFLTMVLSHLAAITTDGSIHFIAMDWRHMSEILAAGRATYSELKNLVIWNKTNAGMGSFYRSKHELIFVFKSGTASHINTFGLGETGRYRTNVWDYAGSNTLKAGRADELAMHPTVKPVALVADAIRDCSRRNHIVLDPFMGSGTTIIAAEKSGRIACGLELDPAYVDVAVRRYEAYTGKLAILDHTGQTFAEVAAERGIVPAKALAFDAIETENDRVEDPDRGAEAEEAA